MSNEDSTRRKVLENKYPEMEQHFSKLKNQAYEPKIERLGQTTKDQKQRNQDLSD